MKPTIFNLATVNLTSESIPQQYFFKRYRYPKRKAERKKKIQLNNLDSTVLKDYLVHNSKQQPRPMIFIDQNQISNHTTAQLKSVDRRNMWDDILGS